MTEHKTIGTLTVTEVIDNADGSASLVFDIPDDFKARLKKALGWKRWSNKKFEKYIIQSLTDYVKGIENGTIVE